MENDSYKLILHIEKQHLSLIIKLLFTPYTIAKQISELHPIKLFYINCQEGKMLIM